MDGTASIQYQSIGEFVATMQGGADEPAGGSSVTMDALVGSWTESFVLNGETFTSDLMTISVENGALKVNMFNVVDYGAALECAAELSSDGSQLTLKTKGVSYNYETFQSDLVLAISEGGKKLTMDGTASIQYQSIGEFVATKQGAVEPEQPADPWATAASFTNDGVTTANGGGAFMKELKVYADEENVYVRVTVTNSAPFAANMEFTANNFDVYFADGEGSNEITWAWKTLSDHCYTKQMKGIIDEAGHLTYTKFNHNGSYYDVAVTSELVNDELVWGVTYPREYIELYETSNGTVFVGCILWNGYDDYWCIPQSGNTMLEVTLP